MSLLIKTEKDAENEELKARIKSLETGIEIMRVILESTRNEMEIMRIDSKRKDDVIADLERRLKIYENAHTPPSAEKTRRKKIPREPSGRSRGGQPGHKGATRHYEPDEEKEYKSAATECSKCGGRHLKKMTETRIITEVQPPPPPKTTKHIITSLRCADCGAEHKPDTVPDLPRRGNYGKETICGMVTGFTERLTFENIPNRMINAHGLKISTGTAFNMVKHAGMRLKAPAEAIRETVRAAGVLHIDETSFPQNGKNAWAWVFLDPKTNCTLYGIAPGRGRKVIRRVLGDDWDKTIVCDGYRAYFKYDHQRCWAHLIREVRKAADDSRGREALARLRMIHNAGKDATGPPDERRRLAAELKERLIALADEYDDGSPLGEAFATIRRAAGNAFLYVTNEDVDSTNNAAERALRELVVHRKIRGGMRSEDTGEWLAYLFTCIMTWKAQGLDPHEELKKYL